MQTPLPTLDQLYGRRLRNPNGPESSALDLPPLPAADSQGFDRLMQPAVSQNTTGGGYGYTPPPVVPTPAQQTGAAIIDFMQGPPPAPRAQMGGVITRGNEVYTVAPGFDRPGAERGLQRVSTPTPDVSQPPPVAQLQRQAQATLATQRAQFDFSQPPPTPADRTRELTTNLVRAASNAPGATPQGIDDALTRAAALTSPPKVDRIGTTVDVQGTPMVFTQQGNLAPVPKPAAAPIDFSQPPPVQTVDGVRFYQPAPNEPWKPLREESGAGGLDPLVVGGITEKVAAAEKELAQHQAEMVGGDTRYGFANLNRRQTRVDELKSKIAGFKAMLGSGTKQAPDAPSAPKDAAPQSKLYEKHADGRVTYGTNPATLIPTVQQMLNDGVIDEAAARALLIEAGLKPKAPKTQ